MRKPVLAVCEHTCSLISTFVICYLDSIIPLLALAKLSRPWLFSVAKQPGLSLTWSQTPEDMFSRDVAH